MARHLRENANLYQLITEMYEEKIPFNRMLGFQIEALQSDRVCTRFDMQGKLIGNYIKETLHGGVISAVLDATGGLNASIHLLEKLQNAPMEEIKKGLARIGTIDLRVDYLRPGRGHYFLAAASIMRAGRKVAVTRMELHNDQEILIAVGTGTYIIG
ncbi:MAG: thioesterase family protein [Desulfobacterales bacterium]|nr:thioesterase family protein [Desulfobacterales bacterium]MDJ0915009.1 thioesterase family protein [Desulfobacterales bacterium]